MASELLIILDDSSDDIRYTGADWGVSNATQWYGGTMRSPNVGVGSLSVAFEGIGIAFYGVTPALPASQTIAIAIDGNPPYTTTYGDATPPSYGQWYQSPELADGKHNITITQMAGTSFDYAIVTPSPSTSVEGSRAILDDDIAYIQYNGNWRRSLNEFKSGILPDGSPFHNGTHRSWTKGDSFSFHFSGTSLAIYGIFSWATLGSLSVTHTLDGIFSSQSYSVTPTSPEFVNNVGDNANFMFFSKEYLEAGEHIFAMNITECTNQTFVLDYVAYSPSFSTLSQMPGYSPTSRPSAAKPSTSPSAPGSSSNVPVAPKPLASAKKPSTQMIALAASAGGLFAVAFLGLLLFYLRKRRSKMVHKRKGSNDSGASSKPLMQERQRASTPRSGAANSHKTVSPFHSYQPACASVRPDSGPGLKRYRQEEWRRSRQNGRPILPPIDTRMVPSAPRDRSHPPASSLTNTANFRSVQTNSPPTGYRSLRDPRLQSLLELAPNVDVLTHVRPASIIPPVPFEQSYGSVRQQALNAQQSRRSTFGSTADPSARDESSDEAIAVGSADAYQYRELTQGVCGELLSVRVAANGPRNAASQDRGHSVLVHQQQRLTPLRRGFNQDNCDTPWRMNILASRSAYTPQMIMVEGTSLPNIPPGRVGMEIERRPLPLQPTAPTTTPADPGRLTPVRRTFNEPLLTNEPSSSATMSSAKRRTPSIVVAFPRLSAMLGRRHRPSPIDVPEGVSAGERSPFAFFSPSEAAPPAYESLSPRRGRSAQSSHLLL